MINKLTKTLVIFALLTVSLLPVQARVFELSSSSQQTAEINTSAEVYKPSKLIVGSKTGFVVKAGPGSYTTLTLAADEQGESILARVQGIIGEKGITEIMLDLPDDKELINKVVYFEVAVWKNEDLSDIERARIIAPDGINTGSNAIAIYPKPDSGILPNLGPAMPGVGDITRTMDAMRENNTFSNDAYYFNKPLILRNLRTPETKRETDE